jgi:hypothetical protein
MTMTTTHSTADLAEVLFASTLQASEAPSNAEIRMAIEQGLRILNEDCFACISCVAQEAGDHPDAFARRMHWALRTVQSLYGAQAS